MNELITVYGARYSTLTDNGLVFTDQLALHKGAHKGFEKLLQAHQIRQKNESPGHPHTRARSNEPPVSVCDGWPGAGWQGGAGTSG